MEAKTDELFSLIKSLSRSEKRYFKVQTSRKQSEGRESNYLRLFDAIDRQTFYCEELIITQFSGEVFMKHLPSEKNYLYNLILRVLHKFHAGTSQEISACQILHETEILFNKGLYEQSGKQLAKAKKIIQQNELYYLMPKLSKLQIKISSQSSVNVDKMVKKMHEGMMDSSSSIQLLTNQAAYIELYTKFFVLIRQEGEQIRDNKNAAQIHEILSNDLLKDITMAKSEFAKEIFHFIHYTSLYVLGRFEESYAYYQQFVKERKNTKNTSLGFSDEMSHKANACEICLKAKKYDEVERLLQEINQIKPLNFLQEGKQFHRYYSLKLTLLNEQNRFVDSITLVNEIKQGLKYYQEVIHKSKILLLNYQISYAFFGAKQYKICVQWISKIIEDSNSDLRKDILSYARLLNLMAHCEMKDFQHLEYLVQSSRYFLSSRDKLFKTEAILLKFFKRLINIASLKEEQVLFLKLYTELQTLQHDEYEKGIFNAIGVLNWVKMKISPNDIKELPI
ncbi:MAG: hypothetical protein HYR91_02370 [Flavobacteriia bacterium]|nr:hypothetical protein [Flavobacteriia bacterium]